VLVSVRLLEIDEVFAGRLTDIKRCCNDVITLFEEGGDQTRANTPPSSLDDCWLLV
jgi:hypothetical protein